MWNNRRRWIVIFFSVIIDFWFLKDVWNIFFFFVDHVVDIVVACALCVCQGAGDSELPLTATHIYNRTENKTTAVTYKVSISIHQYRRFILSLARSNARARTIARLARSMQRQHYFRLIYGSGRIFRSVAWRARSCREIYITDQKFGISNAFYQVQLKVKKVRLEFFITSS